MAQPANINRWSEFRLAIRICIIRFLWATETHESGFKGGLVAGPNEWFIAIIRNSTAEFFT
jgi:hypothetical protein